MNGFYLQNFYTYSNHVFIGNSMILKYYINLLTDEKKLKLSWHFQLQEYIMIVLINYDKRYNLTKTATLKYSLCIDLLQQIFL